MVGRAFLLLLASLLASCSERSPERSDTASQYDDGKAAKFAAVSEGPISQGLPIGAELVKEYLADPALVFVPTTQEYLMVGTGSGSDFPFYKSKDGKNFTLVKNVIPGAHDTQFDYCYLWAPDIEFIQGTQNRLSIIFSAARVRKGASCSDNAVGGKKLYDFVTSYEMKMDTTLTYFTKPKLLDFSSSNGPASFPNEGCNISGCEKTIRIDSERLWDPVTNIDHLFYTWTQGGNHIGSISTGDMSRVTRNVDPNEDFEEFVTEAPDAFYREGRYYLIYSHGAYFKSYGLSYLVAGSVDQLIESNGAKKLMSPIYDESVNGCDSYNGKAIRSAGGHSQTLKVGSDYYIYFHMNELVKTANGCHALADGWKRHVYRKKLYFLSDGALRNLRGSLAYWNNLGAGYTYSLDAKVEEREYAPCISANQIGSRNSVEFEGTCGGHQLPLGKVQLRVCAAKDNRWDQATCSLYRDLQNGNTQLNIPAVSVSWNDLGPGYKYSLDARKGSLNFAPCIAAGQIQSSKSISFNGFCTNQRIGLIDVELRICAALNDNWAQAVCSPYSRINESMTRLRLSLR